MKKTASLLIGLVLIFSFAACVGNQKRSVGSSGPTLSAPEIYVTSAKNTPSETAESAESLSVPTAENTVEPTATETAAKTLVVYFSVPETTNPVNMTKEEDNSVVVIDGEVLGNTQYMAFVIQQNTGADLFRIEPEIPYTTNHAELVELAKQEQVRNERPAILNRIENFENYETVFIGYPIWWTDMPMILYAFFDSYDFSGKTIVPFSTHGGNGFAGTPNKISGLEPGATIAEGMTVSRDVIQDAEADIVNWLRNAGYAK